MFNPAGWVGPFLTQRWVTKITQIGLFSTQQFLECMRINGNKLEICKTAGTENLNVDENKIL